ncbi:MAG: VWA domain-containing protein, partial [Acidobacteriota bacterium]|nr:VWA domain-containing protein [Acidobacteriota bacterium]
MVVVATILCGLIFAFPSLGQEELEIFEERLEITEVLLDVIVTDRRGNPVAGLGPSDFLLEENDNEMELTGADFYTTRYDNRSITDDQSASPASRYFIFFFHDARSTANRFNRLMQQQTAAARNSRSWIEQEMQPSDWVAITGYRGRLKVFQDFTQDREVLARAISEAERGRDPEKSRWTREPAGAGAPSLLRELPPGQDTRRKTRNIHSSLRWVAEAAGRIVGRKTLLYFGIGFGDLDGPGLSALPDRRYYPEMERALNDNNVAVYAIDLTAQGTRHAQSSFLNTLALDTGGIYYRNFISFATP